MDESPRDPRPVEFLKIPDAAKRYPIGHVRLGRLIRAGEIAHLRLGRRILVRPEAVEAWLLSQERDAVAAN